MKRQSPILAGTAIALLMASAPLAASPLQNIAQRTTPSNPPLVLAQAECLEGESAEDCAARLQQQGQEPEQQPEPEAQPEPAPQAEPEPQPEAPPAEPEPAPEAEQPQPAPEAEQPQPAPEAEQPQPAPEAEQPQPAPEAEQPQPAPEAEQPQPAPEAEQPQPAPEAEQPEAEQPQPAPEAEQPQPAPETNTPPAIEPAPETNTPPPSEQPAPEVAPAPEAQQPAPETNTPPPSEQPAPEVAPAPEQTLPAPAEQGQVPLDGSDAPVLDSQKQPAAQPAPGTEGQGGEQNLPAPVEAGPPPVDDKAAQEAARPDVIDPVTVEQGTRVEDATPENRRNDRPEGAEVVREIGDRIIIQINNQIIVESNDRPRIARGAQEVYYEELPRGRTREVIIRENGNQVITIRDRYGNIIRRSRITPDGREYVLVYVDDQYYERVGEWRDPGLDLPPLRLGIPVEDYILVSDRVDSPDDYYEFLRQPPVERVERLYSVDEVKRSARIRDKTRRVDLDTITFGFGKATIEDSEVERLQGVAAAMEKLLEANPAETFLIEGHTDAVGSDVANLALSDRRAEAVADALSNVFGIPPENLATQGYGEQYLKVRTENQERENRRVAIRRITPLVAPVASAN